MTLLTQNRKMKETAIKTGVRLFNFGLPAFRSKTGLTVCPNAKYCTSGCYARNGAYVFGAVVKAQESRLKLTLNTPKFIEAMASEIAKKQTTAKRKGNALYIRIHDSGDFYSETYLKSWVDIMNQFSDVQFYAYTKQVSMIKKFKALKLLPDNFIYIFSFGGKQDNLIDTNEDRHAKVFETLDKFDYGYVNASSNDLNALNKASHRVGLIYHGAKKYSNTKWKEARV